MFISLPDRAAIAAHAQRVRTPAWRGMRQLPHQTGRPAGRDQHDRMRWRVRPQACRAVSTMAPRLSRYRWNVVHSCIRQPGLVRWGDDAALVRAVQHPLHAGSLGVAALDRRIRVRMRREGALRRHAQSRPHVHHIVVRTDPQSVQHVQRGWSMRLGGQLAAAPITLSRSSIHGVSEGVLDAKDQPVPLVRQSGRGSRELLRVHLQELQDPQRLPIRRGCPVPGRHGHGGHFVLDGVEFQALNGGPLYSFSEAISFFVKADTQEEIDDLWDKLTADGEPGPCGWLKDKYGLSWQVVPPLLGELARGSGCRQGRRGDAGDDGDGKDRHRGACRGRTTRWNSGWVSNAASHAGRYSPAEGRVGLDTRPRKLERYSTG